MKFSSTLASAQTPKLISGEQSRQYSNIEYLSIPNAGVFGIRFEYYCSPFRQAAISNNLLLVGHEAHFYLYDLETQQNILSLEMNGYFGHFYLHDAYFYVADACDFSCIDKNGNTIWKTTGLGIDGVIINTFTANEIHGSCEMDPPGGWTNFILDLQSGIKKS